VSERGKHRDLLKPVEKVLEMLKGFLKAKDWAIAIPPSIPPRDD